MTATLSFDSFLPQSFERMVQSLCMHVFGPGLVVFGSGPDGGREASFEGRVPYPSKVDNWSGYIVVQAKCKEIPRGGAEDVAWLVKQLSGELKKFSAAKAKDM